MCMLGSLHLESVHRNNVWFWSFRQWTDVSMHVVFGDISAYLWLAIVLLYFTKIASFLFVFKSVLNHLMFAQPSIPLSLYFFLKFIVFSKYFSI